MKAQIRHIDRDGTTYTALTFCCPGCISAALAAGREGYMGLHMLPVNSPQTTPTWDWDGNLEAPTLSPSILTTGVYARCHSFLRAGVFEFLSDCTHELAGQHVPMPDLPEWAVKE